MAVRRRGDSWMLDVLIPTGQVDPEGKDILERYRKTYKKKKEAVGEHDKMRTMVREKRFLDVNVSSQFILPIRSWSKFLVNEAGLGRI